MGKTLQQLEKECQEILNGNYRYRSGRAIDLLGLIKEQPKSAQLELLAFIISQDPGHHCKCQKCLRNANSKRISETVYTDFHNKYARPMLEKCVEIIKITDTACQAAQKVRQIIFSFNDYDSQVLALSLILVSSLMPYLEIPRVDLLSDQEYQKNFSAVKQFIKKLIGIYWSPKYEQKTQAAFALLQTIRQAKLTEKEEGVALAVFLEFITNYAKQKQAKESAENFGIKIVLEEPIANDNLFPPTDPSNLN